MVAPVIIVSTTDGFSRVSVALTPIPSRKTLPPPNLDSCPYTVKSFSMAAKRLVSPRRTLSPTVGP